MKPKNGHKKMAKKRTKSVKKSDECNSDEESFETTDSTDPTIVQTTPSSKAIKKLAKKTDYLRQKRGKLKLSKKTGTKKATLNPKKRELKANNQTSTKNKQPEDAPNSDRNSLIVTDSLFGNPTSRVLGRSSVVAANSEKPKSPIKGVLVPSWRTVCIKPTYKLEGTENLNDEFYLKRHQKHENEEKLIKKRDLRRQREEYLKFKMLNRNRMSSVNKNYKNKVKNSIQTDLNNEIIERKIEEINFDDIEHILIVDEDDLHKAIKEDNECQNLKLASTKKDKKKSSQEKKFNFSTRHNLENSRPSSKKISRRKSFPCVPLKPVNDNLNNISVNTNSRLDSLNKAAIYDDIDSDYNDCENSLVAKGSKSNKRKPVLDSGSFPDKKRSRLSTNVL